MTKPLLERHGWMPPERRYDHPERRRMRESPSRFKWLAGGRRSGKTTDSLDHIVIGHGPIDSNGFPMFRGCLTVASGVEDPTFVVAAPTLVMLRRIWWDKVKRRVPQRWVDDISEQRMEIRYTNGSKLMLIGLDDPTHAEGIACDGLVVDEMAYVKETAWKDSLRPTLSTPGRPYGWAILQGKPRGRNHFYHGWKRAADGKLRSHASFHWKSSVVIDPRELAQARLDLDAKSYREQYEASFETYSGLAYHAFGEHNRRSLQWNPNRPLAFAWDFGTHPGTVVVCQMHDVEATHCTKCATRRKPGVDMNANWNCHVCHARCYALMPVLVVIGEAYQRQFSTTAALCDILIQGWAAKIKPHTPVRLYGDPAGFSGSTRSRSSDWDEIQKRLGRHFNTVMCVRHVQPPQRDRINRLNDLCQSETGLVRLLIDPDLAPKTFEDFENTVLKENGSGEIDKKASSGLFSHCTDALGYLALEEFPRENGEVDAVVVGT